jgi:uncharacterized protein YigE (DUF2233 family)
MKNIPRSYKTRLLWLLLFFSVPEAIFAQPWQVLSDGLSYRPFHPKSLSPFATLHVFDIDPQKYRLTYCANKTKQSTTAQQAVIDNQAVLAFNGAFFSTDNQPLGLRVQQGKILSKYKPISWWGIFYINNRQAFIKSSKNFHFNKQIDFAVQAGPRLLIDGKIPKLKPGVANRTAIGLSKQGHLLVVITKHAAISTHFLATFFSKQLNSEQAINLDGGSSSQFFANIKDFKPHVSGYTAIPDPICVFALSLV